MTLFGGLGWHVAVFRHDSNVACPQLGPSRLHLLRVKKGCCPGCRPHLFCLLACVFGGAPTLRYSAHRCFHLSGVDMIFPLRTVAARKNMKDYGSTAGMPKVLDNS